MSEIATETPLPPPPPPMQLDTAILHETLIRLLKGMVGAYELWFCKRTGRTLKKDWMDHVALAREMTGRFNLQQEQAADSAADTRV